MEDHVDEAAFVKEILNSCRIVVASLVVESAIAILSKHDAAHKHRPLFHLVLHILLFWLVVVTDIYCLVDHEGEDRHESTMVEGDLILQVVESVKMHDEEEQR